MEINPMVLGEGLGLKAASKAERYRRALQKGNHAFYLVPNLTLKFKRLFEKLGYRVVSQKDGWLIIEKSGRHQPKDNLEKFHRIEAIDPITGKARIFTFPIRKNKQLK